LKNNFYVYEHWRLDRDECFYVGKGKGNRAYRMSNRNSHHKAIQAKLIRIGSSMEVRVVADGLTNEEAILLEIERISFWKDAGADLTNMTDGGEGATGRACPQELRNKLGNPSMETSIKLSIAGRGRIPWNKGVCLPEGCRSNSKITARKGRHSDESRAKMSEAVKCSMTDKRRAEISATFSKKTVCLTDGKTFPSNAAAAQYYGLRREKITDVCNKKRKTTGGGVFAYIEEDER